MACLFASAAAGNPVSSLGEVRTIMAGLECGEVSTVAWRLLAQRAEFFMTVPDSVAAQCMQMLASSPYGDPPIIAGESPIAGLAGLLYALESSTARRLIGLDTTSKILLLGTEGATDPELYRSLTGSHLA